MAYREVSQISEKEFMKNANGIIEKTGGITLDTANAGIAAGAEFKAGTAFYESADGYVPVAAETTVDVLTGAGLLAHDVVVEEGYTLAGLVVHGVPDEAKCTGVTDAFKEATQGRLLFNL